MLYRLYQNKKRRDYCTDSVQKLETTFRVFEETPGRDRDPVSFEGRFRARGMCTSGGFNEQVPDYTYI